jgi:diguanylate cyclase (GGDEF)-like protein
VSRCEPRRDVPHLVLRFAVLTALGLALATWLIVVVVRHEATAQAQRHAIDRTRFATESVLKRELRPADLRARQGAARRGELDGVLRSRVLLEGIRGVALFDERGRLVLSTGTAAGGLAPSRLREVLAGEAVSETADAVGGGRTLRTYVPIVVGRSPSARGVAAFEQDYGPIQAAAARSTWLIAGVLEGLLLLLFLVLAPVLLRVTRRIRTQIAEIDHAATHDDLTQIPNRLAFRRAVERKLASNEPGAVALLDLDGFSELNQVFGSYGGDAVLVETALRLRWELAGCDLVARLGEDEFAVVLDGDDRAEILAVAAQAREAIAQPALIEGVRVAVGSSVGAAILGEHGSDFETVLRRAGAALAAAKESGDGIHVFDPGHEADDLSRAALVAQLREALASGELRVHYQPQADLVTRQIRGVEALLRWDHPEHGLLPAGTFIAGAERSGIAREIRRFVLAASARQWSEWHRIGIDLELSVNLSPVDVFDLSLPDEIGDLLARYGIPAWNLILEITERTLVGDERRVREVLDRLRDLGVRLAIDDFGTGYSSLSSLSRFPVQLVKLDRSLLAGGPEDPATVAVVGGSVEMAHAIGATVLAEGIETREQWTFAHNLGCDIAQGYLIGRPMPGDELVELLESTPILTAA